MLAMFRRLLRALLKRPLKPRTFGGSRPLDLKGRKLHRHTGPGRNGGGKDCTNC